MHTKRWLTSRSCTTSPATFRTARTARTASTARTPSAAVHTFAGPTGFQTTHLKGTS